jgi:hypothetical protein
MSKEALRYLASEKGLDIRLAKPLSNVASMEAWTAINRESIVEAE